VRRIACAVTAAALLLAACGRSSAGSEFVARANRICARADAKLDALPAVKPTIRSYDRAQRAEVAIVNAEIAALSALKAPRGRRVPFRRVIANARADVGLSELLLDALHNGQPAKLRALVGAARALDERTEAVTARLRVSQCGRTD
jgi:hypothetical protein